MTLMSGQESPSRSLSRAVRQLRQALGESQEQFARRLKTAVRTIARYEGERPPTGLVLARLKQLADTHDLPELAKAFQQAIENQLGDEYIHQLGESYVISLSKPEEIAPVRALVESLRNPVYQQIAAKATRVLAPLIEEFQKISEQRRVAARLTEALLAAYRTGKTDRELAHFFELSLAEVRAWRQQNGLEANRK
jgi:transcriptional regulator with XRE-family HTH domain